MPSLSGAAVAHTHATQVFSASHASQHADCDASARAGLSAIMSGAVASWPAIGAAHDGVGAAICSVSTSDSVVRRAYVAFGWSTLLNGRVVGGRFATRRKSVGVLLAKLEQRHMHVNQYIQARIQKPPH